MVRPPSVRAAGAAAAPAQPPFQRAPDPPWRPQWQGTLWFVCAAAIGVTGLRLADPSARRRHGRSTRPLPPSHHAPGVKNGEVSPAVTECNLLTFPPVLLAWWLHRPFVKEVEPGMSRHTFMQKGGVEPGMAFSLIALLLVGVGSMYFHATLSTMGQILDEMCICWANYYAILLVIPRADWVGYEQAKNDRRLVYPVISHVSCVATIILLPAAIVLQFRKRRQQVCGDGGRVLRLACTFHFSAVACWVIDRVGCDSVVPHLSSALGFNPQLRTRWPLR
eukprot:gene38346-13075_t